MLYCVQKNNITKIVEYNIPDKLTCGIYESLDQEHKKIFGKDDQIKNTIFINIDRNYWVLSILYEKGNIIFFVIRAQCSNVDKSIRYIGHIDTKNMNLLYEDKIINQSYTNTTKGKLIFYSNYKIFICTDNFYNCLESNNLISEKSFNDINIIDISYKIEYAIFDGFDIYYINDNKNLYVVNYNHEIKNYYQPDVFKLSFDINCHSAYSDTKHIYILDYYGNVYKKDITCTNNHVFENYKNLILTNICKIQQNRSEFYFLDSKGRIKICGFFENKISISKLTKNIRTNNIEIPILINLELKCYDFITTTNSCHLCLYSNKMELFDVVYDERFGKFVTCRKHEVGGNSQFIPSVNKINFQSKLVKSAQKCYYL